MPETKPRLDARKIMEAPPSPEQQAIIDPILILHQTLLLVAPTDEAQRKLLQSDVISSKSPEALGIDNARYSIDLKKLKLDFSKLIEIGQISEYVKKIFGEYKYIKPNIERSSEKHLRGYIETKLKIDILLSQLEKLPRQKKNNETQQLISQLKEWQTVFNTVLQRFKTLPNYKNIENEIKDRLNNGEKKENQKNGTWTIKDVFNKLTNFFTKTNDNDNNKKLSFSKRLLLLINNDNKRDKFVKRMLSYSENTERITEVTQQNINEFLNSAMIAIQTLVLGKLTAQEGFSFDSYRKKVEIVNRIKNEEDRLKSLIEDVIVPVCNLFAKYFPYYAGKSTNHLAQRDNKANCVAISNLLIMAFEYLGVKAKIVETHQNIHGTYTEHAISEISFSHNYKIIIDNTIYVRNLPPGKDIEDPQIRRFINYLNEDSRHMPQSSQVHMYVISQNKTNSYKNPVQYLDPKLNEYKTWYAAIKHPHQSLIPEKDDHGIFGGTVLNNISNNFTNISIKLSNTLKEKSLILHPNSITTLNNLFVYYIVENNKNKAKEMLNKMQYVASENISTIIDSFIYELKYGDLNEAIENLEKAILDQIDNLTEEKLNSIVNILKYNENTEPIYLTIIENSYYYEKTQKMYVNYLLQNEEKEKLKKFLETIYRKEKAESKDSIKNYILSLNDKGQYNDLLDIIAQRK